VRTASTPIRIDTTAPAHAVTFPGNGVKYNAAKWNAGCLGAICGTAGDTNSGIASVRATVQRSNNGQWWTGSAWQKGPATILATGTTAWNVPLPTSKLANGVTYTVTSWTADRAGNTSPTAVRKFVYDTKGPTTTADDIATSNNNGVVNANKDTLRVTFDEQLRPSTVPATATLTLSRSNGETSYRISGITSGLLSTGGTGYLGSSINTRTVSFAGVVALTNGNKTVTFTVTGPCTGSCGARISTRSTAPYRYRPASSLRDMAGNAPSTALVTSAPLVIF
jgi:hypothetical protein